jgi:hypothetical protein
LAQRKNVTVAHNGTNQHTHNIMVLYTLTFINNICRYLQISAQISGHASRYLVMPRRHLTKESI